MVYIRCHTLACPCMSLIGWLIRRCSGQPRGDHIGGGRAQWLFVRRSFNHEFNANSFLLDPDSSWQRAGPRINCKLHVVLISDPSFCIPLVALKHHHLMLLITPSQMNSESRSLDAGSFMQLHHSRQAGSFSPVLQVTREVRARLPDVTLDRICLHSTWLWVAAFTVLRLRFVCAHAYFSTSLSPTFEVCL